MRAYINNIIIFNQIEKDYIIYLRIILNIINKYHIYISTNKSFFNYSFIKSFGYIEDGEEVSYINDYTAASKQIRFFKMLEALEIYNKIIS